MLLSRSYLGSAEHVLEVFTLFVPPSWGVPFWTSLIGANSRVGGLREIQQQNFEAGVVHFPTDYMETPAQLEQAQRQTTEAESLHARMPTAKRLNYSKLKTASPFAFDCSPVRLRQRCSLLLPAPAPWSFADILERPSNTYASWYNVAMGFLTLPTQPVLRPVPGSDWFGNCNFLVTVRLVPVDGGIPRDRAHVYALGTFDAWKTAEAAKAKATPLVSFCAADRQYLCLQDIAIDDNDMLSGYVTSGGFSLARGEGFALATILLADLVESWKCSPEIQSRPQSSEKPFLTQDDKITMIYKNTDSPKGRYCIVQLL